MKRRRGFRIEHYRKQASDIPSCRGL